MKKILSWGRYILLSWPIIAPLVALFLKTGFYSSLFIFFIIPSIYLTIANKKIWKRASLFSIIFLPLLIVFDYFMERSQGWHVDSILESYRIFGYASFENIVWSLVFVYFIVAFYETFLHHHVRSKVYYPKIRYFILLVFVIVSFFLGTLFIAPALMDVNYFYLKIGLFAVVPPVAFMLWKNSGVWRKLVKTQFYFLVLFFNYELVALNLNQWSFPAKNQFLGFLTVGYVHIPYEELIFWIFLSAIAIVSYFEIFDDEER